MPNKALMNAPIPQKRHEGGLEVPTTPGGRHQLRRRPIEQQVPIRQHDRASRMPGDLAEMMGRVEHRGAAPREPADELPHALALTGIERGSGLVERQHGRVAEQGQGHVQTLAVAAGQALDTLAGALAQAGLVEHALDGCRGIGHLLQARKQSQVLAHRQLRVDGRLLRRPAGGRTRRRIR